MHRTCILLLVPIRDLQKSSRKNWICFPIGENLLNIPSFNKSFQPLYLEWHPRAPRKPFKKHSFCSLMGFLWYFLMIRPLVSRSYLEGTLKSLWSTQVQFSCSTVGSCVVLKAIRSKLLSVWYTYITLIKPPSYHWRKTHNCTPKCRFKKKRVK